MTVAKETQNKQVTVFYLCLNDISIYHQTLIAAVASNDGQVVIPAEFEAGKSIIAVCEGKVTVLNPASDR